MTSDTQSAIRSVPSFRTLALTAITMIFFAANSLLARLALRDGAVDAASFTAIRIAAGAASLALLMSLRQPGIRSARPPGSSISAFALFSYALCFSFAYLSLSAGAGALTLFAAVQITMLAFGIARGERPRLSEWIGLALALGGLAYLASPGLTAPSPLGLLLMTVSGASWGYYSLAAKGNRSPIAETGGNFVRAVPMAAMAVAVTWAIGRPHIGWSGAALAAASGAVTSGLGYAMWYAALKELRTSLAAIVQLTVPVLASLAGVMLLGEQMTVRLGLASGAILGGVALAVSGSVSASGREHPRS